MITDDQIIDSLGGSSAVAELCEVTVGAVSQWRTDGIPKARLMYLKLLRPDAFDTPSKSKEAA
ncbi:DNA-binding transcriptional regulator Cro [Nitrosospira sp. Nl5]|uniref:Cro/CI family transcriptional regulator n=1 Tax=Nitrosospira sp. Nl5 TaxID=200120 RepID=UPI000887C054|nr:Cro/CI family transcriptional regulator [Nitrosospira sp. Nl5]SCX93130.1 DNA-binding transcriptional regulator Cro [Nitrosospira sp. Nl5]